MAPRPWPRLSFSQDPSGECHCRQKRRKNALTRPDRLKKEDLPPGLTGKTALLRHQQVRIFVSVVLCRTAHITRRPEIISSRNASQPRRWPEPWLPGTRASDMTTAQARQSCRSKNCNRRPVVKSSSLKLVSMLKTSTIQQELYCAFMEGQLTLCRGIGRTPRTFDGTIRRVQGWGYRACIRTLRDFAFDTAQVDRAFRVR